MNILLLGTGGADGIPGFASTDRVSEYARAHGGKEVRTRTGALIDDEIKIDLPPDTFGHVLRYDLHLQKWSSLLVTHSHEDHLCLGEIQYALYPFTEEVHLNWTVFSNDAVLNAFVARYPNWPLELVRIRPFKPIQFGSYTIVPIAARHAVDEECLNFVIERDGRKLCYATDTGIWPEATFQALEGRRLHLLVIECTEGLAKTDYEGHLNIETLSQVLDRLRKTDALAPSARVVTTHHSHSGNATHDELIAALRELGAEPGFDGMSIDF